MYRAGTRRPTVSKRDRQNSEPRWTWKTNGESDMFWHNPIKLLFSYRQQILCCRLIWSPTSRDAAKFHRVPWDLSDVSLKVGRSRENVAAKIQMKLKVYILFGGGGIVWTLAETQCGLVDHDNLHQAFPVFYSYGICWSITRQSLRICTHTYICYNDVRIKLPFYFMIQNISYKTSRYLPPF
jgi:hypothetical protein